MSAMFIVIAIIVTLASKSDYYKSQQMHTSFLLIDIVISVSMRQKPTDKLEWICTHQQREDGHSQ
jgi:hypothetical protein